MAWNLGLENGNVCCAMDARRKQVYNALFRVENGIVHRLTPDRAISLEELFGDKKMTAEMQILVGDGAGLCYNYGKELGARLTMAPANLVYQSAWGVARAAMEQIKRGETIPAGDLAPVYLRLSQAERERLEREQNGQGSGSK
jgi:tRNA threonylcarbamoyladenosine biosynthesis protein TsaB